MLDCDQSVTISSSLQVTRAPLEEMVIRMLSGYRDYLGQDVRFDDTTARGLLDGSGVPPATLSPEAIHRLIDRALVELAAAGRSRMALKSGFTKI